MNDKKYYYDEQIKNFFYKEHMNSFTKVKGELKDTTLSSLLALETKQGLIDVAKRVEIKGYSKLGKDALIKLIADNITNEIPKILEGLSYRELIFLNEKAKEDICEYDFKINELTLVGSLSSLGILSKVSIDSKLNLVVAKEAKKHLKELIDNKDYIEDLKERSKAISFIDGLMIHYGMIDGADIYKLISEKHTDIIKKEDLDFYINYIFRSYEAFTETNSLIHPYVFSPADIFAEINVRKQVPYDYDDVEYFINIGQNVLSTYGNEIEELKSALVKRGIDASLADLAIDQLIYYVKNDMGTMSIVALLSDIGINFNDENDSEEIVRTVMNVYNNTHMWGLKGLTPIELEKRRTTTIVKEKEPGRNDPCPCGSGKKYKKCCGRNK
ncbi:MAG: SEC-C metal-binding domain-containing protein [Clostridiaceae bacterium]|nr:SEC-C metal-binding domain-containing protein [Clostridiaceae bacterium]